jgi:hypothetical protein
MHRPYAHCNPLAPGEHGLVIISCRQNHSTHTSSQDHVISSALQSAGFHNTTHHACLKLRSECVTWMYNGGHALYYDLIKMLYKLFI